MSQTKYVVENTLIGGGHKRGDVISAIDFHREKVDGKQRVVEQDGDATIQRLVDRRAIRPATAEESNHKHVTLPLMKRSVALEEELNGLRRQVSILTNERNDARQQLADMKAVREPLSASPPTSNVAVNELVKAKEKVIFDLQRQLKDLHAELAAKK